MAVTGISRIFVSLVVGAAAVVVGWWLWDFYTLSPWTRDARVQANIVEVAPDVSGLITAISWSACTRSPSPASSSGTHRW